MTAFPTVTNAHHSQYAKVTKPESRQCINLPFHTALHLKQNQPIAEHFQPPACVSQLISRPAQQQHGKCGRFAASRKDSHCGLAFPIARISLNVY